MPTQRYIWTCISVQMARLDVVCDVPCWCVRSIYRFSLVYFIRPSSSPWRGVGGADPRSAPPFLPSGRLCAPSNVAATASGSAMLVDYKSKWSNRPSPANRRTAISRSSRKVQQMQPLAIWFSKVVLPAPRKPDKRGRAIGCRVKIDRAGFKNVII